MPRLNLRGVAALEPGTEDRIHKTADSIIEEVRQQTEALGLLPYPRPTSSPHSLDKIDLEGLTNQSLGQLYIQYTAHAQYVSGEVAKIEAAYRIATANLKKIDAKLRATLFARDTPKAEIPTRVKEDPLYVEFDAEVVKLFAMRVLLEAHYKAYDKQAAALSRIISLRELEFEQSLRESNIDSVKHRKGKARGRPTHDFSGRPLRPDD